MGTAILVSKSMDTADKGSERRLKRGLEDLSPLFHSKPTAVPMLPAAPRPTPPAFDVQFLTVCVPDHEGDAFFANAYLASLMVRQTDLLASLVSIAPGFNKLPSESVSPLPSLELLDSRISRVVLSHQELWALTQNHLTQGQGSPPPFSETHSEGSLVFLDFEPSQFRALEELALLLDRVVLFVEPRAESLREAYRLVKIFWNLNREIEFYLLFRGQVLARAQKEFLFERFSLITSRFLGVSISWLGDVAFPEKKARPFLIEDNVRFNFESILAAEGLRRPLSPEKSRLWHHLRQLFHRNLSFSHESEFHHDPF